MKPNNTKPTPQQEDWASRFDKLWRRISNTIKTNYETRKIWIPDLDDEEGDYVYVDETLKRFISTERTNLLNEVRELVEGMKEPEPVQFELAKLRNGTLDDLLQALDKLEKGTDAKCHTKQHIDKDMSQNTKKTNVRSNVNTDRKEGGE